MTTSAKAVATHVTAPSSSPVAAKLRCTPPVRTVDAAWRAKRPKRSAMDSKKARRKYTVRNPSWATRSGRML